MSIKLYNNQNLYNITNSLREAMFNNNTYNIKEISQILIAYFQTYQAYIDGTFNEYNFQLINLNITNIGDFAFAGCTNLALTQLPENITNIGEYAFNSCTSLALTKLPENLTNIKEGAFYNCTSLALTELPKNLIEISYDAFEQCTNLKTLTFKGTPQSIKKNAFYDCSNLKTINVPWSEGEVANAPWGATNATINYNYTGE